MNKFDLRDLVLKVIGPIEPIGKHEVDERRLENFKQLTELVDRLIFDIAQIAPNDQRHEASMKAIGKHARDFLNDMEIALSERKAEATK